MTVRRRVTFTPQEVGLALSLTAQCDPSDPRLSDECLALILKARSAKDSGYGIFVQGESVHLL